MVESFGRFPTIGEYRAWGRVNPATIRGRFGHKWDDVRRRYLQWLEYRQVVHQGLPPMPAYESAEPRRGG